MKKWYNDNKVWLAGVSGYIASAVLAVVALVLWASPAGWKPALGMLGIALGFLVVRKLQQKWNYTETGTPTYTRDVVEVKSSAGGVNIAAVRARLAGGGLVLTGPGGTPLDPLVQARLEEVIRDESLAAELAVQAPLDAALDVHEKDADASGMAEAKEEISVIGGWGENVFLPAITILLAVSGLVIGIIASPSAAEKVRNVLEPLTVHKTATGTDKVVVFSEELSAEIKRPDARTITFPVVEGARWVVEIPGQEPVFATPEVKDSGKDDGRKVTTGYTFKAAEPIAAGTIYLDPTDPNKLPSRKRPIPR